MSGSRRNWLLFALGCALTSMLTAVSGALAQAGEAAPASPPASSPPAATPERAPVAPVEPASRPEPATQPVPALPTAQPASSPAPVTSPTTPAATSPGAASTAPSAARATGSSAAQQEEQQEDEPSPATTDQPQPSVPATTATGASPTASSDAEITLGDPPTEASDDDDEELVWSAIIEWGQSYNAGGLARGGQLSYNPEYVWDFIATLGYKLDERTSLALRQPLTIELTDSDITNTRQELWVLDTTLDAVRELWSYEPGPKDLLMVLGGVGLVFPVSPTSQAADVILGTRAKVGVDYEKEDVLHGLAFGTGFAYLRRWATSNTLAADTEYPCILGDDDIAQSCTHLGGYSTTRDVLKLDVHGELRPLKQLAVNLSFALGWNRAHGLSDYEGETLDGTTIRREDASTTHWRNTREIVLGVGYDFTDWFSASANVTNAFSERNYLEEDGELRAPFKPVDMALGLNLAVSIDQLYLAQTGRSEPRRGQRRD